MPKDDGPRTVSWGRSPKYTTQKRLQSIRGLLSWAYYPRDTLLGQGHWEMGTLGHSTHSYKGQWAYVDRGSCTTICTTPHRAHSTDLWNICESRWKYCQKILLQILKRVMTKFITQLAHLVKMYKYLVYSAMYPCLQVLHMDCMLRGLKSFKPPWFDLTTANSILSLCLCASWFQVLRRRRFLWPFLTSLLGWTRFLSQVERLAGFQHLPTQPYSPWRHCYRTKLCFDILLHHKVHTVFPS